MAKFGVFLDKEQRFFFNGPDFNVASPNSQYLYFTSREEPKKPREIVYMKILLPNFEAVELETPQKDWVVDIKYRFKLNGLHTIELRHGATSAAFSVNVINGQDITPPDNPDPVSTPANDVQTPAELGPPFDGAIKVPCSDPTAIYQDENGQCWASKQKARKQLQIQIGAFLPGAIAKLQEKTLIDEIFATTFNFLPLGWTIEEISVSGSSLNIILIEEGTPALIAAISGIVAALMPLLLLAGIVVLGYKLIDLRQHIEETKQTIEKKELGKVIESNKDNLIGRIEELRQDGLISEGQATSLIKQILQGDVNSLIGGAGGLGSSDVVLIVAGAVVLTVILLSIKKR